MTALEFVPLITAWVVVTATFSAVLTATIEGVKWLKSRTAHQSPRPATRHETAQQRAARRAASLRRVRFK